MKNITSKKKKVFGQGGPLGLVPVYLCGNEKEKRNTVMFGNSFCFLFSQTCIWEYNEKTIFL